MPTWSTDSQGDPPENPGDVVEKNKRRAVLGTELTLPA